jgi:hypothetical protein
MYSGKFVFAQLLPFVDRYGFNKCVKRYFDNYHIREFDCWNQFLYLFFGQLLSLPSLRSVSVYLKARRR